jgi:hypothetical protein
VESELLLNYGVLGVMVTLLLYFAQQTISRLITDRDRAEERAHQLQTDVVERVVPALERSIEANRARAALDETIHECLVDVRRWLENHGGHQ